MNRRREEGAPPPARGAPQVGATPIRSFAVALTLTLARATGSVCSEPVAARSGTVHVNQKPVMETTSQCAAATVSPIRMHVRPAPKA